MIESEQDPQIAEYREVRERDLIGIDSRPGVFVAESRQVVERMLEIGSFAKSVLVETRHARAMRAFMDATGHTAVPLFVATDALLQQIAGFDVHRGVLAIGNRPPKISQTLDCLLPRRDRLTVLAIEDVTNADNMGSLYRNAAAFGVDFVLLSPRCHDHLYRKCLRVSLARTLRIPTVRSTDWIADLARLRTEWNLTLVAAALTPDAVALDDASTPDRVALLVGSEFTGLSPAALAASEMRVRIPMTKYGDSLNVATAAAVCLHRFSRGERF